MIAVSIRALTISGFSSTQATEATLPISMKENQMTESPVPAHGSQPSTGESAEAFRGFEIAFKEAQLQEARDLKEATTETRRVQIKEMIGAQISDVAWAALVKRAHDAAKQGAREYLLLRFPGDLCTDGGRAINNPPDPSWPQTLRGEAAAIYERWHAVLQPLGFSLSAQMIDFKDGKPGDVGLFLFWGE